MGISQSSSGRFSGRETVDEKEFKSPIIFPGQRNINNDSSRFSKLLSIFQRSVIYKAVNFLFRKFRFVISALRSWPRKSNPDDPILPIRNPITRSEENPSLLNHPLISEHSPSRESLADLINSDEDDIQVADIEWGKHTTGHDDGLISVPDPTWASSRACEEIMCSCSSCKQEIAPQYVERKEREEGNVEIKTIIEGIKWIKHYNSRHRILVVGEGDFSFSSCLALVFGRASNMISTSLDSKAFLKKNYSNAPINIMELRRRECMVIHGIDATTMSNHERIGYIKFDRIIFNFPFAGFFKTLSRESQLKRHRRLVSLFIKNAKEMICEDGEVHITHKTNDFHVEWKLESVASSHGLKLIEAVEFNGMDYPGYNTKCGFGGDNNFNCNPSKTYKFGLKTAQYKS